jgi:two-component system response regulator AgrA
MTPIVLCDDDHFTLQLLSELLERAIRQSKIEAKLVCMASTGQELLQFIRNGGTYLYFIDYDLGRDSLNGVDLVRQIYRIDPNGKIVFVTSHGDKGMDILRSGIRPFGFIEKCVDQEEMVREYTRYLKMAAPEQVELIEGHSIELPIGIDETVRLEISGILYVDSVKTVAHSICYHTFDGSEITVRETIEHAQKQLGENFIRCHRSVLINIDHILSLQGGTIKLSNGSLVFCALGRRKAILAGMEKRKGMEK